MPSSLCARSVCHHFRLPLGEAARSASFEALHRWGYLAAGLPGRATRVAKGQAYGCKLYFDLVSASGGTSLAPYSYVPSSQTVPYFTLAGRNTLADRMFRSNTGPSLVPHQYLVAGATQIATGEIVSENPEPILNGIWGCGDRADDVAATLEPNGVDGPSVFPCFTYPTIADQLDAKSLSWKHYAPGIGANFGDSWSASDAVYKPITRRMGHSCSERPYRRSVA